MYCTILKNKKSLYCISARGSEKCEKVKTLPKKKGSFSPLI